MNSTSRQNGASRLKVAVVGGSLGGLASAVALRGGGHEVTVYERSADRLHSRGAGIVVQGELLSLIRRNGGGTLPSVSSRFRQYLTRDGGTMGSGLMPQAQTSWDSIYNTLRAMLPDKAYQQGREHVGFDYDPRGVTVRFADGGTATADLLVVADGQDSVGRRQLLPDVRHHYAGYVAWRGLVDEADLPADLGAVFHDQFTFFQMPGSHILAYFIPGPGDVRTERGGRRLNWVWYVNADEGAELDAVLTDRSGTLRRHAVPPGLLREDLVARQKAVAADLLAPAFARLVAATKEPFVQGIYDVAVPRMAFGGRVALLGDAAFIVRPHTAASTAKAASDAMALADSIAATPGDLPGALASWEAGQLALGNHLVQSGMALGERSQATAQRRPARPAERDARP